MIIYSKSFQCCGSGSGINNPDHISESLETIFLVEMNKSFDADLGSRMEKIRIPDKDPKSATLNVSHLDILYRTKSFTP
jgi:hypothetical protein